MNRKELAYFSILHGVWFILLLEYVVLHLDLALPLMVVWGIVALLFDVKVFLKYAITVTYE